MAMKQTKINKGTFYLGDCMTLMKDTPDNFYELAIVDPPYGIDFGKFNRTNKDKSGNRYKANKYKNSEWDNNIPDDKYFNELIRVSKNQIIWGGNYFPVLWENGCKGFIFWYKQNPVDNFSDGELAYSSFDKVAKCFNYKYFGAINRDKVGTIHPTQKPVALYKWLLKNYAKEGDKILDTHLGSGSIAIACHYMDFELTGIEIDEEYYNQAMERIKEQTKQRTLI